MRAIQFAVAGSPVPQGNLRAGIIAGRARVINSGPKFGPLHAWREAIATEARAVMLDSELFTGAVALYVVFRLQRPKGHYRVDGTSVRDSAPSFPAGRPDGDKLARACLDALTGVVWRDDSQVVDLVVRKRYGQPGAVVEVRERV